MKTKGMGTGQAKIAQNILSLYGLQIANYVLPILILPYLTRVLGTNNFGYYSIFFALMQYALIIVDFGFSFSSTAKIASIRDKASEIAETFIAVTILRLGLAVVGCLVVVGGLKFFKYINVWSEISIFVASLAWCVGIALFPSWLFQGLERMGFVTIFNLIGKIASTVLIFMFVKRPEDMFNVVAIYGMSNLIIGIVAFIYGFRLIGRLRCPSRVQLVEELRRGWPLFFTSLFSVVLTNSGVLIAGLFLSPAVVGGYAAVERLAKAANTMFQPITQAIFPRISSVMSTSVPAGLQLVLHFAKPVLVGVVLTATALIAMREYIVTVFSGEPYIEYAVALIPLGFWLIFGVLNNFAGIQVLTTAGHARVYSRAFVLSGTLALILTFLILPHVGYLAVPFGILFGEILLFLLLLSRLWQLQQSMLANSGEKNL